jgi:hypothetical protein
MNFIRTEDLPEEIQVVVNVLAVLSMFVNAYLFYRICRLEAEVGTPSASHNSKHGGYFNYKPAISELHNTDIKLSSVEEIILEVIGDRKSLHDTAVCSGINECYRIIKRQLSASHNSKSMPRLCTCEGVESDPPAVCAGCGGLLW